MFDEFVPFAHYLRPLPPEPVAFAGAMPAKGADIGDPTDELVAEYAMALSAVRRFRAGLADALDAAVAELLAEIAENVLARELRLAAADVAAIIAKTRERFLCEGVVSVRVHPRDFDALGALEVDAVFDDRLAPGDVIAEVRSGTIDLRLRTRLEIALAACAQ